MDGHMLLNLITLEVGIRHIAIPPQ